MAIARREVSKQWHLPYVFHKKRHLKYEQQRALHVHQRKTKHVIVKLCPQPFTLLHTFSILVLETTHTNVVPSTVKNCFSNYLLEAFGLTKNYQSDEQYSILVVQQSLNFKNPNFQLAIHTFKSG